MLYIGSLRFHALKQKSIRVRAVKAKPKALRHFKVDTPVLKIDETVYNLYGLLLSGSIYMAYYCPEVSIWLTIVRKCITTDCDCRKRIQFVRRQTVISLSYKTFSRSN